MVWNALSLSFWKVSYCIYAWVGSIALRGRPWLSFSLLHSETGEWGRAMHLLEYLIQLEHPLSKMLGAKTILDFNFCNVYTHKKQCLEHGTQVYI